MIDVCVVGGGVMGSATAAAVSRRGQTCVLIEQFSSPGHGCGSSDGDGRIYRHAYAEDHYLHLMDNALKGWSKLEEFVVKALMHRTGYLDIAPRNSDKIVDQIKVYEKNGLRSDKLDSLDLQKKFPQIGIPSDWEALYQDDAGVLFATEVVQALWSQAEHYGCSIIKDRVSMLTPPGSQCFVTVQLESGATVQAKSVVLACGSWTNKILKNHPYLDIPLPLRISQETVAYFQPSPLCPPSLGHTMSDIPTFMAHVPNGLGPFGYYGIPIINTKFGIRGVKVANHCSGASIDPDQRLEWGMIPLPLEETSKFSQYAKTHLKSFDDSHIFYPDKKQVHEHEAKLIQSAQDFVQKTFPFLDSKDLVSTTRCLYSLTPDHDFILDTHPHHPEICIAAGFSGHGFKFGFAVGEIMACLALKEDISNCIQLPPGTMEKFSLQRFSELNLSVYDDSTAKIK